MAHPFWSQGWVLANEKAQLNAAQNKMKIKTTSNSNTQNPKGHKRINSIFQAWFVTKSCGHENIMTPTITKNNRVARNNSKCSGWVFARFKLTDTVTCQGFCLRRKVFKFFSSAKTQVLLPDEITISMLFLLLRRGNGTSGHLSQAASAFRIPIFRFPFFNICLTTQGLVFVF